MKNKKLIIISGGESTGKTALCRALGEITGGIVVAEFARIYLTDKQPIGSIDHLLSIAEGQKRLIEEALAENGEWVIVDTWIYVLMIWAKVQFGRIPDIFFEWEHVFDVSAYLLCAPDIVWEPDPLRENEHDRMGIYHLYKDLLKRQKVPVIQIDGQGKERLEKALKGLSELGIYQ